MNRPLRLAAWCARLSLADLWVAGLRTALEITGIGITLGLMTLLWGLKTGIVSGFAADQLDTPEATRIFVSGFDAIGRAEIEWLSAQPETAFVQPDSSYINSRVTLRADARSAEVLMLPTGPGDPYLGADMALLGPDDIVLGADTAEALMAGLGATVTLALPPICARGAVKPPLTVRGIAPTDTWHERAVLMDPSLIAAIDQCGFEPRVVFDGSAPNFGLTPDDRFHRIRLYATALDTVAPLVHKLNVLGWNARSRERLIAERRALERSVDLVFWLVFAVALVALALGVVFGLVTRALRLARPLTTLRGAGMARAMVWSVPVIQGAVLALASWVLAAAVAAGGTAVLNLRLPAWLAEFDIDGPPVVAGAGVYLGIGLVGLLLSFAASTIAVAILPGGQNLTVTADD